MRIAINKIKILVILCSTFLVFGCNSGTSAANTGNNKPSNNPVIVALTIASSKTLLIKNSQARLSATATMSDGTVKDVTQLVVWNTSDDSVLSVDSNGIVFANDPGKASVFAVFDGVTSNLLPIEVSKALITSIMIRSDDISPAKGTIFHLFAIAGFSDGSTQDITSLVKWSISDTSILTISTNDSVLANQIGSANISANFSGIVSNSITVQVHGATIKSLSISANGYNPAKGTKVLLTAIGNFSDGSSQDLTKQIKWSTSDSSILGVIDGSNVATANSIGLVSLIGEFDNLTSNTIQINVIPAVKTYLSISPSGSVVRRGSTYQLTALQNYSDGSTQDISGQGSWRSSNPNVIAVTSSGSLTALQMSGGAIIYFDSPEGATSKQFSISQF